MRLITATLTPFRGLDDRRAAAGIGREVIGGSHDARLAVQIAAEPALVPGVVPERDAVDAGREDLVGQAIGDAGAVGGVLAVRDHEVELELLAQARDERLNGFATRPPEDVGDEEQPHRARSALRPGTEHYGIAGALAGSTRMLAPLPASET